MAIKLQIRRDIKTNWDANSGVILLSGEIGYETDTRNMKIGDGATVWSSLKYQAPYYTAANSGAPNTLLALDVGNSRVGIGNSSPASTLDVTGQVRVRGGSSYSEPSENASVINYDTTGGILTVDARSGGGSTAIAFRTSNSGTGGERLRISSTGSIGIGTASPSNLLHLEGSAPAIRLKDTTAGNTAYSLIDADNDNGSINISADPTAAGAANSTVSLSVDNTTRLQATTTGVAITGTTSSSGALTVTSGGLTVTAGGATVTAGGLTVTAGGLNVAAGSVTLPSNTVAIASLANMAAAGVLGATAAGAVAALTTGSGGTAKTALGLGAAAYTDGPYVATANQVGQIAFVQFDSLNGTDAVVSTGVTSSSTTGPHGGTNTTAPTYVSFGGTVTWSKAGSGTRYVRPSAGTWTCIQTSTPVSASTTSVGMICIRTA